ncbi:hypothetical protein FQN50_005818, partial [Emmonsiellopsis sp. PD_5]
MDITPPFPSSLSLALHEFPETPLKSRNKKEYQKPLPSPPPKTPIRPQLTSQNRPDFTLTLIRTPYLPPRYASFWVPLTFNKLDIKDYLKRAYNVDVLKVRSYVEQQKPTRELSRGREGYGKWRRPQARKKMT